MQTISDVIDTIGRARLREILGVGDSSIDNARARGLPANWFVLIKQECDRIGVPCKHEWFNFKTPSNKPPEVA